MALVGTMLDFSWPWCNKLRIFEPELSMSSSCWARAWHNWPSSLLRALGKYLVLLRRLKFMWKEHIPGSAKLFKNRPWLARACALFYVSLTFGPGPSFVPPLQSSLKQVQFMDSPRLSTSTLRCLVDWLKLTHSHQIQVKVENKSLRMASNSWGRGLQSRWMLIFFFCFVFSLL